MANIRIKIIYIVSIALIILSSYFILKNTVPFKITSLLGANHELVKSYDYFSNQFDDENVIYLSYEIDKNLIEKTRYLTETLGRLKYVRSLKSVENFEVLTYKDTQFKLRALNFDLSNKALKTSLYNNTILSDSSKFGLIILNLNKSIKPKEEKILLKNIFSVIEGFEIKYNSTIFPLGTKVATYYFTRDLIKNQTITTPVLLALISLVVLWVFRSGRVLLHFNSVLMLNYVLVILLIILTEKGFSPYSGLALIFTLVITTSDLIHFFTCYEKNSGDVAKVKNQIFVPCLYTTLTTAIGFGSFYFSDMKPIRSFGLYCAFASIIGFLLTFYFLPSLLRILNLKLDAKSKRLEFSATNTLHFVDKYKKLISIAAIGIITFSLFQIKNIKFEDDFYNKFISSHPITKSVSHFQNEFNSIGAIDLTIHNVVIENYSFEQLSKFNNELFELDSVIKVESINELSKYVSSIIGEDKNNKKRTQSFIRMASLTGAVGHLHDSKHNILHYKLFLRSTSSDTLLSTISAVKNIAIKNNVNIKIAGFISIRAYLFDSIRNNFIFSFALTLMLIFILFLVLFRSLKWALIAMLPNLIPILFIPTCLHLMGVKIENNLVIMMCIIIGIAVDDTIHFLYSIKQKLKENTLSRAIELSLSNTSKALIATTLICICSFPCFLISDLKLIYQMGAFIVLALLLALIADLILLPAILLILDRDKA
jgi:predicted RND superfamily exporter protein